MTQAATTADGSGAMFDAIAKRYDALNRVLSLGTDQGWRRKTAAALNLEKVEAPGAPRILDLATGTADLALEIRRRYPTAQVVGVDPSLGMLEIGRRKVEEKGWSEFIHLEEGDAQALPFEDDAFDACTIAFGIRNVPDRSQGLKEMARVTRPGGRVAVLEASEPGRGLAAPFARFYMHHFIPAIGALFSGSREYRYLQKSVAAFPPPREFARMMEDAGLTVLKIRPLTFGVCHLYIAEVP